MKTIFIHAVSIFQFPLFLTGRAGSGKSTMLQYLFAEIVLRYLNTIKQCDDGLRLPVYLSYSSNLITDARSLCKTLFEKNNVYSKQLREGNISYKEDIRHGISILPSAAGRDTTSTFFIFCITYNISIIWIISKIFTCTFILIIIYFCIFWTS